jgi:tripartite-type tricarboxylate transporter receptor subunit TctC
LHAEIKKKEPIFRELSPMNRVLLALSALLALAGTAAAQQYPSGPVTMVIPFAAGGPTDVLGRIVGETMAKDLGQPIIIENVGGAGGMTGSSRVAKGKKDGTTFLLGTVGTHAQNQTLYAKPQYDSVNDFDPVALIADVPLVLIVKPTLPAKNLQEFIAYAKANKGKMNFGSAGTGSATHLGCVLLNSTAGIEASHVPYRGSGPAMTDLVGGQIDYLCDVVSTGKPQIDAGTVKALAFLGIKRTPVLPDLPTADEQGLKGFEAYTWNALFATKGTPPEIIAKLNAAAITAMNSEDVRKRLGDIGAQIVTPDRRTPAYLGQFVKSEIEKWAAPIRASGARQE